MCLQKEGDYHPVKCELETSDKALPAEENTTHLGSNPGQDEDDEDEDDLDDPEDALEGAEVVLSAPDTPGEVPAGGSPHGRAALLDSDEVAGLGDDGHPPLKYQD